MKITAFTVVALFVSPALAAKTWDVNIVNGLFSPQVLNVAAGDTVRWPNTDGGQHSIVQTVPGIRTCNSLNNGFDSGVLAANTAFERTFPTAASINYKDGFAGNCLKGATGTINVQGTGTGNSTTTSGSMTSSGSSTMISPSGSTSATTSPTNQPNGASYLTPESSVFLGVAAFIGALVL